jgi:hypothetical protein
LAIKCDSLDGKAPVSDQAPRNKPNSGKGILSHWRSVSAYSTSATLTLEQGFPTPSNVKAEVDATLQLENMKTEDIQVGQWINVMGLVTSMSPPSRESTTASKGSRRVGIQALLLWPVRDVDIHRYDKELDRMRAVYGQPQHNPVPS